METIHKVEIHEDMAGQRLDKCISLLIPALSRSRVQSLIAAGALTCKGEQCKDAAAKVRSGMLLELRVPEAQPSHLQPQAMALDIMYEDEHLLVLNKPAGLTVHPAPGHPDHTLVNALLAHCGDSLSGIGGVSRPGIVHRIDKDTSGLMVVAKHDTAHAHLSAQLSTRTLGRIYQAVVWGQPPSTHGRIEGNIGRSSANRQKMAVVRSGGKEAITHYRTLESFTCEGRSLPLASLVECKLDTGRTHQIRVHMAHAGNALLGDPLYGQSTRARLHNLHTLDDALKQSLMCFERQALHAAQLSLIHPHTAKSMRFECPLPEDMQCLLKALRAHSAS